MRRSPAGSAGALELHAELKPQLDALDDAALGSQLDALGAIAGGELYLDLYHDALRTRARGLAIARRTGQTHLMPIFTPIAGTAAWMIGEIDVAIDILDDAIEAARTLGNDAVLAWHLFNRALPELVLGDLERAMRLSEESWALAEPLAPGMIRGLSAAARASALQGVGRPAEAIELLYRHAGGPDLTLLGGAWRGVWFEIAVRCHLDLGDVAAARAASTVLAPWPRRSRSISRADGGAIGSGRRDGDRRCGWCRGAAAFGARRAEAVRSPVYVAWCEELLGLALEAAGDRGARCGRSRPRRRCRTTSGRSAIATASMPTSDASARWSIAAPGPDRVTPMASRPSPAASWRSPNSFEGTPRTARSRTSCSSA